MENIEQVMITNIIEKSNVTFGFAKIASNGEQAYMGPQIFQHNNLRIGQTIYCDIGQNDPRFSDRGCNKRVVFVYDEDGPFAHLLPKPVTQPAAQPVQAEHAAEPEPKREPTSKELNQYIVDLLEMHNEFWTTAEVTQWASNYFGCEYGSKKIGRLLDELFDKDRIGQLQLWKTQSQKRVSKSAWVSTKQANEVWSKLFGQTD